MFLTKEAWHTNNPVVQTIASPYTVWDAVILGLTQAMFMIKVSQHEVQEFRDTNWLLLTKPEALLQLMDSSELEVEDVMVLLPPRGAAGEQWTCERMIALAEKRDQLGVCYEYATAEHTICNRTTRGPCTVTASYHWNICSWRPLPH